MLSFRQIAVNVGYVMAFDWLDERPNSRKRPAGLWSVCGDSDKRMHPWTYTGLRDVCERFEGDALTIGVKIAKS